MKKTRKIIALLLTVLTLMSVISAATPVLAAEVTEIKTETTETTSENAETTEAEGSENTADEAEETEKYEPEILNEMVEWRTESTKYFRNSDGSYTAAQYAYPIHYKENGEWKEIDNTLTEKTVEENLSRTEKEFVAKNTNTPARFPDEFKEDGSNQITVTADGYDISFSPKENRKGFKAASGNIKDREQLESVKIVEKLDKKQNEQASTFKATQKAEKVEKNKDKKNEKFKVENKSGAVVYENVFNNADLEYELNNSKIKESIVLNEKQNTYVFEFNMDFGGLYPVLCENGSINLCSDKEGKNPVAKIEAPYMVDSLGEYSDSVAMTIKADGENYILTVSADENWLNDKERVYPVVIDPTIDLQINRQNTIDCYVDNSKPAESYPYAYHLLAGHSSLGKTRTYIKFNLPELPDDNCIITNAFIEFWQKSADVSSSKGYLNIHEVTKEWNNTDSDKKPTWNKQPSYNDKVLDYAEIKFGEGLAYYFDITRTVKEWYENDQLDSNYGFMLKTSDESTVNRVQLFSAENSAEGAYPAIYVHFRNNKGLESYWDYSSFSVGAAGTAYVNDYTGNLVYELPILSSISEIMPVSIVGYYNNYCAKQLVSDTVAKDVRTSIGRGFRLCYQQTVLPSTKYGLSGDNAETYPYVYTDGDGTEHYIQKVVENEGKDNEKTTYKDEEGLGLTFTTDFSEDGTYKITDKAHNKYYFNIRGNLFKIVDNNGNEIKIIYKSADSTSDLLDKSRIHQIIDGAGHTYTFTYAVKSSGVETDYVRTITDDAGRVVDFDISDGVLTDVKYPNKDTAFISYNISSASGDSEGRINAITSNGTYCLNIDYTSKSTGRRVKEVKEYGVTYNSDKEKVYNLGQVITFDRTKYNTTIMRSCGKDGIHNTNDSTKGADDIITTVQYDNMGRSISQQMKFGSGDEIGAGSSAYTTSDSDDSASGFKNKVSGSGATGKYVENLLYGGNAESTSGWNFTKIGTITASEGTSSASRYIGKKSIKLTVDSVGSENARCYYRQNFTSNVKPNTTYTLSAYVKTGDLTPYTDAKLTGAFIQIIGYDSNGNAIDSVNSRSQILTKRSELDVNNGWRRLSCTVTTNSNVANLRCYLFLRNTKGSVCFDGIQLEKDSTANDYNMLENSHFTDLSTGNEPKSWAGTSQFEFSTGSTVTNGVKTTTGTTGSNTKTVIITGSPNVEKGVTQTVAVEDNPEDTYILSGWAKGFPVNSTFHTTGSGKNKEEIALFEIAVKVNYSASDGSNPSQFKTSAIFNTTITDWQCASVPISLKYTGGEKGVTYTPTSIKIIPRYNNQVNSVYFDKIMLVKDAASSYTYDKDGNLVSASSNSEQKSNMEYDDNNNLTSYTDTAGHVTKMTYDGNNNLTLTKSAKGSYTRYNYSTQGNVEITETRNASTNDAATAAIRTNNDYNEETTKSGLTIKAGAYQTAYRDQNNNKTTYALDHETGTLTSVTDAKQVTTNYTYYNTFGKQKSVATKDSKVSYEYNSNEQLSKIIFGNTKKEEYSFEYDVFGNVKQTKVGSQSLSTNTYAANNGVLEKTAYGNGDSRRYSYNNLGQKIVDYVTDNGSEKKSYSWAYNSSGTNIRHTDYVIGLQYLFDYDSLGRISKEEAKDFNTGEYVGSTEYGYDVRNNLNSLITTYGGDTRYQYYYYSEHEKAPNSAKYAKDNLPTYYQLYYNSRYAIYDYDGLNRLTQRKFTLDTPLYYNYIYKSSDRNASGESLYRTTQISKEFIGNDVFVYGYDVLGNITSIKKASRSTESATSTSHTEATDYVTYGYDELGQLTRENNKTNNKTTLWTYDELGNITAKTEYAYTTGTPSTVTKTVTYGYGKDSKTGWNNLLTSVDLNGNKTTDAGETITYDKIGNPLTYLGATLTWNGRQLTSYKTNDKEIAYTYDSNGIRSSKIQKDYTTSNGVKTLTQTTESKYYYVNGQLHFQDTLATKSDGSKVVTKLYFYYDSYGYLSCIKYNGTNYYVATNKRGDVVALYYYDGRIMGRYEYDAWGNVIKIEDIYYDADGNQVTADLTNNTTSRDLLVVNPIRYRGYYYDLETKLYYLQSRYYDPAIGRFLNADGYLTTDSDNPLAYNMFAYCGNNSVMFSDPSGCSFKDIFNEIVESVKIFSYFKGLFDKITTPKKVVESVIGPEVRQREHAKNTVNTLYNQENNKSEPVSETFEPYKYIEIRTGVSYTSHIDTIINEDTIAYLTDVAKGRSWEEIVEDGDVYEVCHTMIYWDNVMYNNLGIYNQGDMSYTYFDALY